MSSPRTIKTYAIGPARIVLAGHSTGGFVAINTAAHAAPVAGLVLISASDDAPEALDTQGHPKLWRKFMADEFDGLDGLAGCTPAGLARELLRNGRSWTFRRAAAAMKNTPILIVTADDGLQEEDDAFGHAVESIGGRAPTYVHFNTDHPYSDRRIALQTTVAGWLITNVP